MTSETTPEPKAEREDQVPYPFNYGHGRMPLFMKLIWIGFLTFATWYVVTFLLEALERDLAA
jgi:hypothetical protein